MRLLRIDSGLRAVTYGVDYGPMKVHDIQGPLDEPRLIVCKVDGHKAWSGRGQQTYRATRFIVFQVLEQPVSPFRSFYVEEMFSFDLKGPTQPAMTLAKKIQEGDTP